MVESYFKARNGENFYEELDKMSVDELMEVYFKFDEETLVPEENRIGSIKVLINNHFPLSYNDATNNSNVVLNSEGLFKIIGEQDSSLEDTKKSLERVTGYSYDALPYIEVVL